MSKCDLSIELDKKNRVYRGGDLIRGAVHVRVNRDVDCRGIILDGMWRTHGRGNRASGKYYHGTVYSGPLKKGDRQKYNFEIPTPHGPVSYRGKLLNIDHYLSARVDIPWAFDPTCESDFILMPGSTTPVSVTSHHATATANGISKIIGLVCAIFFLCIGLILIPVFGFGLILMVVGGVLLFFSSRKFLAERKIGEVEVQADKFATSGKTIPIGVRFTPKSKGTINRITAKLVGQEVCVSGSGSNRRTHKHTIYQDSSVLEGPANFSIAETAEYFGEFTMPKTTAFSFAASDNSITWAIEVHIDIPNWPDWHSTIRLRD